MNRYVNLSQLKTETETIQVIMNQYEGTVSDSETRSNLISRDGQKGTEYDTIRSILSKKDKNGKLAKFLSDQFAESGICIAELVEYEHDQLKQIIQEITDTIPKTIYKFPTAVQSCLIKGIISMKSKDTEVILPNENQVNIPQNNFNVDEIKMDLENNNISASEIDHLLDSINLQHLKSKFSNTGFNLNHLMTIVKTNDFDQLCKN